MSSGHPDHRPENRIILVVGAHPNAERHDRIVAYALQKRMNEMLAKLAMEELCEEPEVLVCCDIWYLNDESLRSLPTISIGAPGVNALTAFLTARLPSTFVIDNVLMVQVDRSETIPLACCWGTTPENNARAVEAFVERSLRAFVEAVVRG